MHEHRAVETWQRAPRLFEKLAFGDRHEGVLAVGETPQLELEQIEVPAGGLIAVVEGLEKPGNLARGLAQRRWGGRGGRDRRRCRHRLLQSQLHSRSLGTVFTRAVCQATQPTTGPGCASTAPMCRAAGATLAYTAADLCGDVAIVLGSEAAGLSRPGTPPT